MTTNELLKATLEPLLQGRVAPIEYTGKSEEYIVWNHSMIPEVFAEGVAHAARYLVQVHYFLPNGKNPDPMKVQICQALQAADFTTPAIQDANEAAGQHYVFECECCNGGPTYGQT